MAQESENVARDFSRDSSAGDTVHDSQGSAGGDIGSGNFEDLQCAIFVDKSIFVKDFMTGARVQIILRPHHFGKSVNLSMLKCFFSLHADTDNQRNMFERVEIWRHKDICEMHLGKYPVVYVEFGGISKPTWPETLMQIRQAFFSVIAPFWEDVKECMGNRFSEASTEEGPGKFVDQINSHVLAWFLGNLVNSLHEVYGQQAILLVDDYDAPLNAEFKSAEDRTLTENFLTELYARGLKSDGSLAKACLMGINEIPRVSDIWSGLRKIRRHSIVTKEHGSSFGFTKKEILKLLSDRFRKSANEAQELWEKTDGIKHWYNGYYMGDGLVVHPWSVMKYMCSGFRFDSYGCTCSTLRTVLEYCKSTPGFANSVAELFPQLLSRKEGSELQFKWITVEKFNPDTISVGPMRKWSRSQVMHFLCMNGCLTYRSRTIGLADAVVGEGEVRIPNKELFQEWERYLAHLSGVGSVEGLCESHNEIVSAFRALDEEAIVKCFEDRLEDLSMKNRNLESTYQVYIAGILNCVGKLPGWQVLTEVGAGTGYSDMIIDSASDKFTIIMEFKKSDALLDASHDKLALEALKQTRQRQYYMRTPDAHKVLLIACVIVTGGPRRTIKMLAAHLPPGDCRTRDSVLDERIATETARLESRKRTRI